MRCRSTWRLSFLAVAGAGLLAACGTEATGVSLNIASELRGFYGEAGYRVWDAGSPRDLVAFVRYENFDTQFRMPDGYLPLKEFDRDAWVAGLTYYPDPDVAVKVDYVWLRNQSDIIRAPRGFNVGLGDVLAAVRNHFATSNPPSTCRRISSRSWSTLRKSSLLPLS